MRYFGEGVFGQEIPANQAAQMLAEFMKRNNRLAVVGVTFVPLEMVTKDGVTRVEKGCLTVVTENPNPIKDHFPPVGDVR